MVAVSPEENLVVPVAPVLLFFPCAAAEKEEEGAKAARVPDLLCMVERERDTERGREGERKGGREKESEIGRGRRYLHSNCIRLCLTQQ